MKHEDDFLPELDSENVDWWIQLLVDDELSFQQRQELFEYMDKHPSEWRHCAVAFVDARFLTSEIRAMDNDSNQRIEKQPRQKSEGHSKSNPRSKNPLTKEFAKWAFAIAGSILLGIAIAIFASSLWLPERLESSVV